MPAAAPAHGAKSGQSSSAAGQRSSRAGRGARGAPGRGANRRGRGGRGGRGGAPVQRQKIGGLEVSWEHDPELEIDDHPREMFPEIYMPVVASPTAAEKAQVAIFRRFRRHVREGPLYTVSGDSIRINKYTGRSGIVNPFEDMPSYTQKYKPTAKTLPNFATRKYCLKLFPEELWDVIEPKRHSGTLKTKPVQKKRAADGTGGRIKDIESRDDAGEDDEEDAAQEGEALERDTEETEGANPEDDFSDADSDMGGDYNAEQYFDGGEADGDDLDDGGGEDGGFD